MENLYYLARKLLDFLIDIVGENQNHLLANLMDLLALIIEYYENRNVPELKKKQHG